ncbi:MAG: P-II family nitrogen regulator [Clostridiales bacterium]|nr:P-II family nitrogen regulator [Clostridiales bacterium]
MSETFDLIITTVNSGYSDVVMEAARLAGARGGTILHARGSVGEEMKKFFGVTIDPEKEVVLILTIRENRVAMMSAIKDAAGLKTEARGLSFSLPVDDVAGIPIQFDESSTE